MKLKWLSIVKRYVDRSDPKTWMLVFPLLYLAVFLVTALLRVGFPYQLSWLEGAMVDNARWILNGNPLYGAPSVDFTPFFYPPLYSYVSAFFMKIFGVNILIPRLVSLLSTCLVLVLIWRLVKFETGSNFYALTGAGFYASFYAFVRCFYDMARVDALFIFLLFWGVYILRTSKKPYAVYLSAFVFYLAIFTKQQTLVVVVLLGLVLLRESIKKFLKFTLTFSLLCLLTYFYFQWASDGWFIFYIYEFPRSHGFRASLVFLIFRDLLLHAPVLFLIGPYLFFKPGKGEGRFSSQRLFYPAFFIAAFAISWTSRAHPGGVENVLMPLLLSISVLGATSLWHFERDTRPAGKWGAYLVALLIAGQFLLTIYNPLSIIPDKEHYRWNKKLVQLIAGFEGEVLVTQFGYIPILAGKETHTHKTSIDFSLSGVKVSGKARRIIEKEFRRAIRRKRFSAIILRKKEAFFLQKMRGYYKWKETFVVPIPLVLHGVMHTEWEVYVPE